MSTDLPLELILIVNGQDVRVQVPVWQRWKMRDVRNRALRASGNTGRPPDEWEIRDVMGSLVDEEREARDFEQGTRFFISVPAGVGG